MSKLSFAEQAKKWVTEYRERERRQEYGEAKAFAHTVYEAVSAARGSKAELARSGYSATDVHLEALAGALAEWRAAGIENERKHLRQASRSLIAGTIRLAKNALEELAARVERGELLRAEGE